MIQVREFIDTDTVFAEKRANEFLATLEDEQVVNVCYGSLIKPNISGSSNQRSTILVVYKVKKS